MTPPTFTIPPGLMAAGFVGTWDTDVGAGRSVLDKGAAILLAGNAKLAGEGLSLEVALSRTHPDDRGWLFDRIRRVRTTGGPFSAEFRILSDTGSVRWILCRGSLKPDQFGIMRGNGAYIETTDSHQEFFMPIILTEISEEDPLIVAADKSIEVHAALKRGEMHDLRKISDVLLFGIGRAIAQRRPR